MRLHYRTYGSGQPLIILHGLFGSLNNWNTLSKKFGEHFHVYAVDQRNHGRSPHSKEFTYRVMADDLKEFVDDRGLSSAHILGHSMGGKTAMCFATLYPEIVGSLTVVDIAPRAYEAKHDEILEALSALRLDEFTSRNEIDAALSVRIRDIPIRQFLLTNLARNDAGRFTWKMDLDAIRDNYGEMNKAIEAERQFDKPTLFITGETSSYVGAADEGPIRKMFPRAHVVTISGVGHWVHAEAPAEFSRIFLEFLAAASSQPEIREHNDG